MTVRVIGPDFNPENNIIDTYLSLARYNSDLLLAKKFNTTNISPFYPIGDIITLKLNRIQQESADWNSFWSLLEINKVPDFSTIDFSDKKTTQDLINLLSSKKALSFRKWFHSLGAVNKNELIYEYISLLKEVHWIDKLPTKSFRFVVSTLAGVTIPPLGSAIDLFDTFVVDLLTKKNSAKYFLDDLTNVTGQFSKK